jgi:hypothetical protein
MQADPAALAPELFCQLKDVGTRASFSHQDRLDGAQL